MKAQDRAAIVNSVRTTAQISGIDAACRLEAVSRATFDRWARRYDAAGIDGLADLPRSGRPPLVTLTDEEMMYLRACALRCNRGRDETSMTAAARWAANDPASPLLPETRAAILAPRSTKHALPVAVRRACRPNQAEIRRYRDPAAGLADGIHASGLLRMAENADGTLRRLEGGERQVWDDGSINVGVVVPWPAGGDRCAERFGVRIARFQLLAGIDCATDHCIGYNYIVRGNDAYGATDVVRTWHRVWTQAGAPDACVCEGGSWQAARSLEYLGAAGVQVISAKGRPWQKLIEGWFGRLWTQMSLALPGGQVGRFRGEMKEETEEWIACREGRRDPRGRFPSIDEMLTALDRSIEQLNSEPVESKTYGNWIPAEKFAASTRQYRELPAGLWRLALPERHVRMVRNGSVGVAAPDNFGGTSHFVFADRALTGLDGAQVAVSFDPTEETAVIELAARWADMPAGTLLAPAAVRTDARASLRGNAVVWISGAEAAGAERKASRALIAESVRTFDSRGKKKESQESLVIGQQEESQESLVNGQQSVVNGGKREAPQPAPEFFQEPDWAELERRAGLIA